MDIRKCYEIMGLEPGTPPAEVKQAYRDLVNVWHPDRFASNPRLQKKAEEHLKNINVAYRILRGACSGGSPSDSATSEKEQKAASGNGNWRPDSFRQEKEENPFLSFLREWIQSGSTVILTVIFGSILLFFIVLILFALKSPPHKFPADRETPESSAAVSTQSPSPQDSEKESGNTDDREISYGTSYAWLENLQKRIAWENAEKRKREEEERLAEMKESENLRTEKEEEKPEENLPEESLPEESLLDIIGGLDDKDKKRMRSLKEADEFRTIREEKKVSPEKKTPTAIPREKPDTYFLQKQQEKIRRYRAEIRQELRRSGTRFHIREDGSVLDTRTGLMWSELNSFMEIGRYMDFTDAGRYVRNLRIGGYRDWKIPTSSELAEIYIPDPVFPGQGAKWYWTSETYTKGWNRIARIFRPGNRKRISSEYKNIYDMGVVHAVRHP